MVVKRLIVWILSLLIGAAGAFATVSAFGTTVERYAVDLNFGLLDLIINNLFFLFLAIAALSWIWLDYILQTKLLPE